MPRQLRPYGLALLTVIAAAAIRFSLVGVLGYRYGFTFFLIATFVSGRYIGLGPSVFALVLGTIPAIALHFIPPNQAFDPYFQIATTVYFVLGATIVFLCNSEHQVRGALRREIAERRAIETELRHSTQQLLLAIEAGQLGTWELDTRTNAVKWSIRMEEMHGYAPGTFGGTLTEAIANDHPEDREQILQDIARSPDAARRTYRVLLPDGRVRWIEGAGRTIRDESEQPTQMLGVCYDVTEKKEADIALRQALECLEEEQELLRHTIELQEQERQLVTFEIHDGLVQYATGALMQLEAMRAVEKSDAVAEQLDAVVELLQRTVAEGRRIINGIRTPVLDDWGVVAAVEHLIDEEDRAHVQVEFIKDAQLGRMAPNLEEAVYRITQEALTNIRKHSGTKKLRVELGRRGDRVHLEVRDWGVGFTPQNGPKGIHGLRGMTSRARLVGGKCMIDSAPGKGTQVVVDLPYLGRG
jgi:PAS domain S-box-containing protein